MASAKQGRRRTLKMVATRNTRVGFYWIRVCRCRFRHDKCMCNLVKLWENISRHVGYLVRFCCYLLLVTADKQNGRVIPADLKQQMEDAAMQTQQAFNQLQRSRSEDDMPKVGLRTVIFTGSSEMSVLMRHSWMYQIHQMVAKYSETCQYRAPKC